MGAAIEPDGEAALLARYRAVQEAIAAAAERAGRAPDRVALVAVAKLHGADKVRPLLAAGHRLFAENRVQEAEQKWPPLRADCPDARLHLVGPLQSNKVRKALALFDAIETVDRPKLAEKLAEAMAETGQRRDCFVQVNTGEEPQKAGIPPEEADGFIRHCREALGLPLVGLMCIPPLEEEPALHFALLREIAQRNGLAQLSMGMSGDFETAVALGATHVRVGTAIFGERPSRGQAAAT